MPFNKEKKPANDLKTDMKTRIETLRTIKQQLINERLKKIIKKHTKRNAAVQK